MASGVKLLDLRVALVFSDNSTPRTHILTLDFATPKFLEILEIEYPFNRSLMDSSLAFIFI